MFLKIIYFSLSSSDRLHCMKSLQQASAFWFYVLGILVIIALVLSQYSVAPSTVKVLLNIIDLPLLFAGMLFAGSSLIHSIAPDEVPFIPTFFVFSLLMVLFAACVWMNFLLPFSIEDVNNTVMGILS